MSQPTLPFMVRILTDEDTQGDGRTVVRWLARQATALKKAHGLELDIALYAPSLGDPLEGLIHPASLPADGLITLVWGDLPAAALASVTPAPEEVPAAFGTPRAPELAVLACQRPQSLTHQAQLEGRGRVLDFCTQAARVAPVLKYADEGQLEAGAQAALAHLVRRRLARHRGRAWLTCPEPGCTFGRPAGGQHAFCPLHGQVLRLGVGGQATGAEGDPWVGRRLADGRYPINGLLSDDGTHRVYASVAQPRGQPVAVKIQQPAANARRAERQALRFKRETELLKRLNHPSVVRVLDSGVEPDGTCYVVTEQLDGATLAQRLSQLSLKRGLELMRSVLSALITVHEAGLIHRDLSPNNIIIGDQWTQGPEATTEAPPVTLINFGLGRDTSTPGVGPVTRAAVWRSAWSWMAPEQFEAPEEVGVPADLYAVGVMFYQLITGELPFTFTPDRKRELLGQIRTMIETPPPPLQVDLHPELERLVFQALSKRAEDRPADARTMRDVLDQALGWRSTSARIQASSAKARPVKPEQAPEAPVPAAAAPEPRPESKSPEQRASEPAAAEPTPPEADEDPSLDYMTEGLMASWRAGAVVLGVVALIGGGAWWGLQGTVQQTPTSTVSSPVAATRTSTAPRARPSVTQQIAAQPPAQLTATRSSNEKRLAHAPSAPDAPSVPPATEPPDAEQAAVWSTLLDAVTREGQQTPSLMKNARVYLQNGRLGAAEELFLLALEKAPDDLTAHTGLGLVAYQRHQYDRAVDHWRRCTELAPSSAPLKVAVARALMALGRYEDAVTDLEAALKLSPDHPEARAALMRARAGQNEQP